MLSIHKISPMVRAIGVMGAVAAIAGGVTFASLTSNTVALSPNTLTTATGALAIGAGTSCPGGDTSSTPGFSDSSLVPGGPAATVNFCLTNTGSVPLTVTASIPSLPTGTAASFTTLGISCTTEGSLTPTNSTLSSWSGGAFPISLGSGASDNCTASATLSNGYTGSGGEAIPSFAINFVGNQ